MNYKKLGIDNMYKNKW